MALWGNSDNVTSDGTVTLDYSTGVVTGSGTSFSSDNSVGQIIRFGDREGTYFGDATIIGITSELQCTIGSTMGLSGAAIAATSYYISELPSSTVLDEDYSETNTNYDKLVYGVSRELTDSYKPAHQGWVGVTTYTDCHGNARVKTEVLVAMSGITTGANGISYPTNEA